MPKTIPAKNVSLAVLPLNNLAADDRYDYFATGLVEEIIVDLSHFKGLQIISSYTSNQLASGENEITAARKIAVDYLLKGNLRLWQNTVRISTQLIDTKSGEIIWAERFNTSAEQIFELLESIVQRVVFAISSELENTMLAAARQRQMTNLAAYDCYLRGMDQLRHGTLEADEEARTFFNQALKIDPNYSRGYAGLSLSYFNEWSCQLWDLYESSEQNAYINATRAFELDQQDHITHMILGRIYIYRKQFDLAELHIEQSLQLNYSDANTLVQIASCMAYLGRASKGEELFKKALQLNPYRNLWYYQYGSFVYFVMREYETSIKMALKRQLTNTWVDLPGYISVAHAYLGNKEEAAEYMRLFTNAYIHSISRGTVPEPGEILDWATKANPFKHKEDKDRFVDGLLLAGLEPGLANYSGKVTAVAQKTLPAEAPSIFIKEQEVWRLEFDNIEVTLLDMKGYTDIARLLASPDTDIHSTELMGTTSAMDENTYTIDEKAHQSYKSHINDLKREIAEAEENNDLGRKELLQTELDQFLAQLSKDLGLGKRPRKLKSPAERARAAVTLRIRNAIKKISSNHPSLGKHLRNSIRTGVFCRYSPEEPRQWTLD